MPGMERYLRKMAAMLILSQPGKRPVIDTADLGKFGDCVREPEHPACQLIQLFADDSIVCLQICWRLRVGRTIYLTTRQYSFSNPLKGSVLYKCRAFRVLLIQVAPVHDGE